jgi:hypothetical protein
MIITVLTIRSVEYPTREGTPWLRTCQLAATAEAGLTEDGRLKSNDTGTESGHDSRLAEVTCREPIRPPTGTRPAVAVS